MGLMKRRPADPDAFLDRRDEIDALLRRLRIGTTWISDLADVLRGVSQMVPPCE